ncbi:MAG: MFS transporter [Flavobacteriaceae bacterium]|nr:MFS transporter [Flavobacteriaceae bacterium]
MYNQSNSIYTLRFILICISSLFFSMSFNMLIPELPTYLSSLGGDKYIGLIIALFTLTAGLSRPFSGKLTDTIGRKPVMIIGAVVCVICSCLYPILTTVLGFLLLRLLHGFSTGFSPTGFSVYVTDIIPQKRWGEALGVQSLFFSSGLALGPALGSFIKLYYSFDILFYSSSLVAFIAIICLYNIKETLPNKQKFKLSSLKITKNDIIAIEVLYPAFITIIVYLSFGIILTLIPLWSEYLGILNKGTFFIIFTVFSLFIRFVAGKLSDKYSRKLMVTIGLGLLLISIFIIAYINSVTGLCVGASIYGLAMGVLSPTLNAWTVDLSNPKQKGKSIATMYIALEVGIGFGALCSGWYYQGYIVNIPTVFYTYLVLVALLLSYMISGYIKK